MLTLLNYLVKTWYDPDDTHAYQALLTGSKRTTETLKAQHELWRMSEIIRESPALSKVFKEKPNEAFFEACKEYPEGQKLLQIYADFIRLYGQRGMPGDLTFDFDVWYSSCLQTETCRSRGDARTQRLITALWRLCSTLPNRSTHLSRRRRRIAFERTWPPKSYLRSDLTPSVLSRPSSSNSSTIGAWSSFALEMTSAITSTTSL
jgi:hypothetical protein